MTPISLRSLGFLAILALAGCGKLLNIPSPGDRRDGAASGGEGGAAGSINGDAGTGDSGDAGTDSGGAGNEGRGGAHGGTSQGGSSAGSAGAAGLGPGVTGGIGEMAGRGGNGGMAGRGGDEGGAAAEGGSAAAGGAGASGGGGDAPCSTFISDMVCIPGGTFVLGGETTQAGTVAHQATVRSFHIDRNEVSAGAYVACLRSGLCLGSGGANEDCNIGKPGRENYPANCVTWENATGFCRAAGKRLPTEEEWVYAARRGQRAYPWGNELPDATRANLAGIVPGGVDDDYSGMAPVGSFPAGATPEGINDLLGNVWEWVSSAYCPWSAAPCNSCSPGIACENRCNACGFEERVHRGLGYTNFFDGDSPLQWNWRGYGSPSGATAWVEYLGFRCAK